MARISGVHKKGEGPHFKKPGSTSGSERIKGKNQSFQAQFSKAHQQEINQELERLMNDIKSKGEQLADRMNWDSFIAYRDSIRHFVKALVSETCQVAASKGKNKFGSQKLYRHVEIIDQKLAELGEAVIKKEENRMEVIAKIDEIRGLLLDMYK